MYNLGNSQSGQRKINDSSRKPRDSQKKARSIILPVPVKVDSRIPDEQLGTGKQTSLDREASESVKQWEELKVSPKKEVISEKVGSSQVKSDSDSVNSTSRRIIKERPYISSCISICSS